MSNEQVPSEDQNLSALYDKVDQAMSDLNRAQRAFLRAAGWEYSCAHPDSKWRWSKKIQGRNYSLDVDAAIDMQLVISND